MPFLPHTSDLLVKMTQRIRCLVYWKRRLSLTNQVGNLLLLKRRLPTVTCGQYTPNKFFEQLSHSNIS